MLVITGGQRSGTSVLAQMFSVAGYEIGTDWWDDQVDGGLEHPEIAAFFQEVLGEPNFPFEGFEAEDSLLAVSRFATLEKRCQVVKFSYLTMIPALIAIWHKHRPTWLGDKFLILNRDAECMYQSKMRHSEVFFKDCTLLKQRADQIYRNRLTSVSLIAEYGYPYNMYPFDQLWDSRMLNFAIQNLEPDLSLPEEVVSSVYDRSKVHF
ncbi:MAG: hypothetical protein WC992_06735 [Acholeplasmataceae bacterium]